MRTPLPFAATVAAIAFLALLARIAPAQTLVFDFNTAPGPSPESAPKSFHLLPNGNLLFVASTPATGEELWVTDGTAAGTSLVVDLVPGGNGASIRELTPLANGRFAFVANVPGFGWEPWCTDGSAAGTTLLGDVRPGVDGSGATAFERVGNHVVFWADDGTHGLEPWVSDGTAAGTQLLLDVVPGPGWSSNGAALAKAIGPSQVVFTALVAGVWELWNSDLTTAGTQSIRQFGIYPFNPRNFARLGNRAVFLAMTGTASEQCWITDGTLSGTSSLGVEPFGHFQIAGAFAYFQSWTIATGTELWKTDGTVAGTGPVADLMPGSGDSLPWFVGAIQGDVLLFATTASGRFLFRSNGTAAGTVQLSNAAHSGSSLGTDWGVPIGGFVYYRVDFSSVPSGLYRTDGTAAGTTLVTGILTGDVAGIGGALVLAGDDGSGIGREPWISNGTPAGTQLLLDLAAGQGTQSSYATIAATLRDRAVVGAISSSHGYEPWVTDGTTAGTQLLADITPGTQSSTTLHVAATASRLLMLTGPVVADGDPWFSDGTPAGTAQLDILPANSGFWGRQPAAFGERFVFWGRLPATGEEPWITDGTVAGTHLLRDVNPGAASSPPGGWCRLGDAMLFGAWSTGGYGLWRTDGTTAGTTQLAPLASPGGTLDAWAIEFGGHAWFAAPAPAQGIELWRTDGTAAGTGVFADLAPGTASSTPARFAVAGGRLLMQVSVSGQSRIAVTDGTLAGTTVLSLAAAEIAGPWTLDGANAAFVVRSPWSGIPQQLWRTDGTDPGTVFVRSFSNVVSHVAPRRLGVDELVFLAHDATLGVELWSTDGTTAGTQPLTAMLPQNPFGSFARTGAQLVFTADDGLHGAELFAVPFVQTGDWAFAPYGSGCPGTGGIVPALGYSGAARIAAPFALTLDAALPNMPALLAVGLETAALPIPGCTLWLDGLLGLVNTTTDANGRASVPLAFPPALLGLPFGAQFLAFDPAGAAFGFLSATGAAEIVVGP